MPPARPTNNPTLKIHRRRNMRPGMRRHTSAGTKHTSSVIVREGRPKQSPANLFKRRNIPWWLLHSKNRSNISFEGELRAAAMEKKSVLDSGNKVRNDYLINGSVQMSGQDDAMKVSQEELPSESDIHITTVTAHWLVNEYFRTVIAKKAGQWVPFGEGLTYAELARQVEDLPLFVVDGHSGVGKSTTLKKVKKIMEALQYRTLFLGLDIFLKDLDWRRAYVEELLTGRVGPDDFEESLLWDVDGIIGMLIDINKFRNSDLEETQLRVSRAFNKKNNRFEELKFPLDRKTIILIDGKYAFLDELRPLYGEDAFCCRLQDRPSEIRGRFLSRGSTSLDPERRERFHDLALVKSFSRYASKTTKHLNGILDLSPDDDMDD